MRIPLDTQVATFDEHSAAAAEQLTELVSSMGPALVRLARERAFRDVGVHEYGDATYWLSDAQLREELLAELADAVFYLHIALARTAGDLPIPAEGTESDP